MQRTTALNPVDFDTRLDYLISKITIAVYRKICCGLLTKHQFLFGLLVVFRYQVPSMNFVQKTLVLLKFDNYKTDTAKTLSLCTFAAKILSASHLFLLLSADNVGIIQSKFRERSCLPGFKYVEWMSIFYLDIRSSIYRRLAQTRHDVEQEEWLFLLQGDTGTQSGCSDNPCPSWLEPTSKEWRQLSILSTFPR